MVMQIKLIVVVVVVKIAYHMAIKGTLFAGPTGKFRAGKMGSSVHLL